MWVVAKTKACQEKRALNNLENQGFAVFLPYITVKKFKKNIWNIQKELLFPGYIFVNISLGAICLRDGCLVSIQKFYAKCICSKKDSTAKKFSVSRSFDKFSVSWNRWDCGSQ